VKKLKFTLPSFFRKGFFAKKWVRLLLDVAGSLAGLFLLVLLILLARLSMGPINLDFLTPEIQAAFKAPQVGISATIDHTQLVWRKWNRPFEIELVNVRIQKNEKPDWLKIEHVAVSLKFYRLLAGDISLKQLRLYHPHILLEKDEKGEFSLGFGETKPTQEFSLEDMAPLLALGGSNPALGKLNELNRISIVEAHVLLKDVKEEEEWELPKSTIVLRRQSDGFRIEVTLAPQQGTGSLLLGLSHQLDSARFNVYAHFHNVSFKKLIEKDNKLVLSPPNPDALSYDDILNFLQRWDIPLDGKIRVTLAPSTLQIIKGMCDISIGKGELDLSLAKLLPLPVNSGSLSVEFSPREINLKKAALLSDETLIDLSGKLASPTILHLSNLLHSGEALEIHGKVEDLFLDHLGAIWPEDLAHHAREWLTKNLRKGTLKEASFFLKGHGSEEGFALDHLQGILQGEGAELTYLDGLPPLENVNASATFTKNGFDIKVLSGAVENVHLQEGHVVISGLDNDKEALTVLAKVKGPLSDMLDIIDHKPLEYASYAGLDPEKVKGDGALTLRLDFPLIASLEFKDVKMQAKGVFQKVTMIRPFSDELSAQLNQGDFSLDLTQDQMTIKGKGILNQLPSTIVYNHFFTDSAPHELQLQVDTMASFEEFKRLGFDYLDYGKGPVKTTLTFTVEKNKKNDLLIDLDTTNASLSFLPLEWEKKPGEKSNLSFRLFFKEGQLVKIKDIKMTAPPYSLEGAALFGDNKQWKAFYLSDFRGPHIQTQVTLHRLRENAYDVSFKGQSVDLEKFLNYLQMNENVTDHPPTNIKLQADVGALRFGEGKVFQDVKASADLFLHGKDAHWKEVSLRAKAGSGTAHKGDMANVSGGLLFDIKPGPNNSQTLEVRANDAGQFLKNLSIYDAIQGGYITIKAHRQAGGPYVGVFKLKQFDANEVPLLARFGALLSPMGIANLFSENKTLSMEKFESNFEFSEDLINVTHGIGKSISLGFTVEGKIDRKNRMYNLKGNIIPARFLNSILSNIPLIGSLINGGEGEGLFSIAYTAQGKFDAPEVSLNPLSALAPGFIRKLFQSLGDDE
jgi:hypothetical protein